MCTSVICRFELDASICPDGLDILGDVFSHDVVAVHDAGNAQMHLHHTQIINQDSSALFFVATFNFLFCFRGLRKVILWLNEH